MSALIGFCVTNGAFLAADSMRTDLDRNVPWPSPIRKIEKLTPRIVVATGGLGSIGHEARDELIESVADYHLDLPHMIDQARDIFRKAYARSLVEHPGHTVPLTCVIAGQDPSDGSGFICSLRNVAKFEPYWVRGYGRPYFTGSNTQLLIEVASERIYALRQHGEDLPLNIWAVESFRLLSARDPMVGLPAQLVMSGDVITEQFPIDENNITPNARFTVTFPQLPS